MKWVIASVGLLVVIVVFSLAALDQKDVVWNDGVPHCAHCRAEVERFSEVCPRCQRAFDWQSYERQCHVCFSENDVKYFQNLFNNHREKFHAALKEAGATDEGVADFDLYMKEFKPGACAFCGGTEKWIAPGVFDGTAGASGRATSLLMEFTEKMCPVCYGVKRCPLCEGERTVTCGREDSYRALLLVHQRLSHLNSPLDRNSAQERFRELHSFIRKHDGKEEVADLPSFDVPDTGHMERALRRARAIRRILNGYVE